MSNWDSSVILMGSGATLVSRIFLDKVDDSKTNALESENVVCTQGHVLEPMILESWRQHCHLQRPMRQQGCRHAVDGACERVAACCMSANVPLEVRLFFRKAGC